MSVHVTFHDAVMTITLDRPEVRNALDANTMGSIGEALANAEADPAIRCVILTATGDRAFCAGMDLKAFGAGKSRKDPNRPGIEIFTRRVYTKPIIGAANGAAVGGGFELLLACDLIVAADHVKFGLPEVKRGLLAAGGGTRLPRRLPLPIALELGMTGEMIDAPRALALGLINYAVPHAELMPTAFRLANRIAANGPLAVGATKQLMWQEAGPADWAAIDDVKASIFASQDAVEGARAFSERREPKWLGR